jgi:hypothetical protein
MERKIIEFWSEFGTQKKDFGPWIYQLLYSPFCVQAKIIKLVGLKNGGRLSPINLVTFAGTQNSELEYPSYLTYVNFLHTFNQ